MKKTLLAMTSILLSINAFAAERDRSPITMNEVDYEVLKLDNGEEIRFQTHTIKPSMKFEKEITYKNKSDKDFQDIVYQHQLKSNYFFIPSKKQNGVEILYSNDNEKFVKTFDKDTSYIKITIEKLPAESERVINFRYMHDILVK